MIDRVFPFAETPIRLLKVGNNLFRHIILYVTSKEDINISETKIVNNGVILLDNKPYIDVKKSSISIVDLIEVFDKEIEDLAENEFLVDYNLGKLFFNPVKEGNELTINYVKAVSDEFSIYVRKDNESGNDVKENKYYLYRECILLNRETFITSPILLENGDELWVEAKEGNLVFTALAYVSGSV